MLQDQNNKSVTLLYMGFGEGKVRYLSLMRLLLTVPHNTILLIGPYLPDFIFKRTLLNGADLFSKWQFSKLLWRKREMFRQIKNNMSNFYVCISDGTRVMRFRGL